jgi:hypothetical protein
MLKKEGVIFGSIAALLAAFALFLLHSGRIVLPEASRPPAIDQWPVQVEPLTHPPWWRQ